MSWEIITMIECHITQNLLAYIHDLLRIAEKAKLELSEEQKNFLDTLTSFNIKARYDYYLK